ncbi:MAG: YesL family protein [Lachnospiraceae bacterium]|nr:YesL family protein [Lachnospiraceae bacterium]
MKFFSVDSPLYRFFNRLWDIIQLNFFWLICCIPIVTIGASTAAAFHVCMKMVDDEEGYISKEFFKGFKENWKQGTVVGFLIILASYAVYLDVQIFEAVEGNPIGFLIVAMISGFLFFLCLIYAYPLIARYRNTLLGTLKNSFTIARRHFLRTIFLAFILMIEILVWMYNSTTLFIGFLIGPACIMFTIAGMALRIFQQIEKQPNTTVIREGEEENDM